MIKEKKCPKCGIIKNIDQFHKSSDRKDGHQVYCIQCRNKTSLRKIPNKYIHYNNSVTKIIITSPKYGIKECLIDTKNFGKISQYWWNIIKKKNREKYYVQTRPTKNELISMHRFLMDFPEGFEIDHKNNNSLDNRECNLRKATSAQNSYNQKGFGGISKFKGVSWDKRDKKWYVEIRVNCKKIYLGRYLNEINAAIVYNKASRKYHKEFAYQNKIN